MVSLPPAATGALRAIHAPALNAATHRRPAVTSRPACRSLSPTRIHRSGAALSASRKAFIVGANPFFSNPSGLIAAPSAREAIATLHQWPECSAESGLASHDPSIEDAYRLAGA